MKKRVAINGFGRIGRLLCQILVKDKDIDIVAINASYTPEDLAYLYKYDTIHGISNDKVTANDKYLIVNNKKIKIVSNRDAALLPWKELKIDLVLECTGAYTNLEDAKKHIIAGAKHVIISAPGKGDMKTIVYGVNEKTLNGKEEVISAASCTTNALAPILKVIDDKIGIEYGYMSTIHAYTNDQVNLDNSHKKGYLSRRGRACALNIIPTSTGAASAIGKVIPSLEGKMQGNAFRVPVGDGSMLDITVGLKKNITKEKLNELLKKNQSKAMKYTDDPIVSSDIIGNPAGGVVDGLLTEVIESDGKTIAKIIGWYDNEYGYSMQMARTTRYFLLKK